MTDQGPIPSPVPSVITNPVGPSLSYSAVRAATTRAESALDGLERKIRRHLSDGMDSFAKAGAAAETKVLSRLADGLAQAETVHSDTVDLLHNQLAAGMAPSVALLQDIESPRALVASTAGGAAPANPPVVSGALRAASPAPRVGTLAGSLARQGKGGTAGPLFFGPLKGEQQPGLVPPGPCPMIDEPTWLRWQAQAQAIADKEAAAGGCPGEDYTGNWWRVTEDCCVTGPVGAPDENPIPGKAKFFDFGVDGFPSCAKKGFAWFLLQWNPKMLACHATGPVDCLTHPTDPSCPVDCIANPTDPRCPPITPTCPPPCIDVTCPPPVINVPPCPPLNLPTCIAIDLCDWDKFCKFLKDCLVKSKEDCALDNDVAYSFKDCDGTFGSAIDAWYGDQLADVATPDTFDELLTSASAKVGQFGDADLLGPEPY